MTPAERNLVLVTGATGAVGPCVVQALQADGYPVRTLSLDAPEEGSSPPGVEALVGDINDPAAIRGAMDGIHGVVHLAALLHTVNPTESMHKQYEQTNIAGTAKVVDAAVAAGVRRIVFFSSITVYGNSNGQVITEDTPPRPNSLYGKTKLAAEEIILKARRGDGQALGTVLRMAAIYGARVKGNYRRLVRALASHRFVPVGKGLNRRTVVYDRDVASATVLALSSAAAAGRVYNVSDGQIHAMREIIAAVCQALGRKPPRLHLPAGPAYFILGLLEDVARFARVGSPIGRATIDKYVEDLAVDSSRIQKELGFSPRYDLYSGWRETVQEMRQRGDL